MAINRVNHLAIAVKDMEASLRFYRDLPGMRFAEPGVGISARRTGRNRGIYNALRTMPRCRCGHHRGSKLVAAGDAEKSDVN